MFISCFLIRSSSRSSGPSYSGILILYGVAIRKFSAISCQFSVSSQRALCSELCALRVKPFGPVLSGVCGGASAGNLFALLVPAENGFAHSRHGLHRFDACALGAGVNQLQHTLRVLLVLHSALADGRYPLDQVVRHRRFTLDAADARGAAALRRPLQRLRRRE